MGVPLWFSFSHFFQPDFMDFWFIFKKGLSIYLHPLTIAMELIVVGVVLIGFSRRRTRKEPGKFGRWLKRVSGDFGVAGVIGGILFLFAASIRPVADPLVFSLEKQHPPLRLNLMSEEEIGELAPDHIVVLAGGERYDPEKPSTSQLSYAALARVNEGARLAREFPKAGVVFTGRPDEVRAMTEAAIDLGVSRDRIQSESESRDTKDHPKYLRPILGDSRFLLVTSGTHMPRAMYLFRAEGYEPIAAACDLWVWPRYSDVSPYRPADFVPKVESLWMTHTAFHELMGLTWARYFEARDAPLALVGQKDESEKEPSLQEGEARPPAVESVPLPLPDRSEPEKERGPRQEVVPDETERENPAPKRSRNAPAFL